MLIVEDEEVNTWLKNELADAEVIPMTASQASRVTSVDPSGSTAVSA